jgi:outer membrane receptor for ferrienterochelin and colicins
MNTKPLLLLLVTPPLLSAQNASPDVFQTLDPMVVTGSVVVEPLKDAPVRTEVIGRELIDKSAARDLAQIVEYSPGLRVETTCSNCNQQAIQLLGLPQSYIAILADGLPTFSGLAGVYGIEQIPTGLIGQVEVVKGGGSALYGPGAVAGVINLIPRDPQECGGIFETRITDSAGKSVGSGIPFDVFGLYDWVLPEQDLKITAFANYSFLGALDLNGDNFTDVSERELSSGGLRAVWQPSDATKLSFEYFISDESRRGGEGGAAFDGPPNYAVIAEEIFSNRQVATFKWEQELAQDLKMQLAYAYSKTARDSYYGGTVSLGSPDPASPFFDATWTPDRGFGETRSDLHFIDALFVHEVSEEHRFWYGAQYRTENLTDDQSALGRSLDESYSDFGLLAQHRWKISDLITAEYGARVDFHSAVEDPILSPRANLLIEPTSNFRIRNSIGWGFRAPEVFNEDLHIANVGGDLQATTLDPALREESSVTLSIAPEWQITDRWRLEVNGFHTWLDDTFVDVPDDNPATPDVGEFLKTNGGGSAIYGAEINLGYAADDWRVEFSWTEQRAEYDDNQLVLGDDTFADPADNPIFSSRYPRTPEHLGLIKFFHEGEWFDTFVACKLTGPMDLPHVVTGPGGALVGNRLEESPWFFNVDVGFSKEMPSAADTLTLSIGVKNLFNDFQDDIDRGAFRDADYIYGPAFPRTVYAGAKWEF